jgi:hypothetical protein
LVVLRISWGVAGGIFCFSQEKLKNEFLLFSQKIKTPNKFGGFFGF